MHVMFTVAEFTMTVQIRSNLYVQLFTDAKLI